MRLYSSLKLSLDIPREFSPLFCPFFLSHVSPRWITPLLPGLAWFVQPSSSPVFSHGDAVLVELGKPFLCPFENLLPGIWKKPFYDSHTRPRTSCPLYPLYTRCPQRFSRDTGRRQSPDFQFFNSSSSSNRFFWLTRSFTWCDFQFWRTLFF